MKVLAWLAVPLLIIAACMLVVGIGAPGLWIAVVAVGVALVVIGRGKPTTRTRRHATPFGRHSAPVLRSPCTARASRQTSGRWAQSDLTHGDGRMSG
jgi:hypothetical protein